MNSRRNFLKLAGTGILATGLSKAYGNSPSLPDGKTMAPNTFSIGMAGYTFIRFSVEKTIEMMKRLEISSLSVKDVQMPISSTQAQIAEVLGKFKAAGIIVYTVGVIYMKSQEEVDRAFAYAKMAGVNMIVGAPDYDLIGYAEDKVRKYDIRLAIHNHGPDNPLYPNASDIWKHIKDLDPRMGICLDIGHTVRDGQDPSADIRRYITRIFDMHVKDVDKSSKEGKTVEMGRGIIDIPKLVETLRKVKYSGKCSLEFEKDMDDPLPGIAESLGYLKGVMACR